MLSLLVITQSILLQLIEDVSSTPLILNVEVEMLEGPITINIPPPPSDRLWYASDFLQMFALSICG